VRAPGAQGRRPLQLDLEFEPPGTYNPGKDTCYDYKTADTQRLFSAPFLSTESPAVGAPVGQVALLCGAAIFASAVGLGMHLRARNSRPLGAQVLLPEAE